MSASNLRNVPLRRGGVASSVIPSTSPLTPAPLPLPPPPINVTETTSSLPTELTKKRWTIFFTSVLFIFLVYLILVLSKYWYVNNNIGFFSWETWNIFQSWTRYKPLPTPASPPNEVPLPTPAPSPAMELPYNTTTDETNPNAIPPPTYDPLPFMS